MEVPSDVSNTVASLSGVLLDKLSTISHCREDYLVFHRSHKVIFILWYPKSLLHIAGLKISVGTDVNLVINLTCVVLCALVDDAPVVLAQSALM